MSSPVNLPNFSTQIPSVANAPPETLWQNTSQNLFNALLLLNQLNPNFFSSSKEKKDKDKYAGLEEFAKEHKEQEKKVEENVKKFIDRFQTSSTGNTVSAVPATDVPPFLPFLGETQFLPAVVEAELSKISKPLSLEDLRKELEEQKKISEKPPSINKKEMYKIRENVRSDADYYKKEEAKQKISILEKKIKEMQKENKANNTETKEKEESKPMNWWQTFLSGMGIK